MPNNYKVLAQSAPAATTNVSLYTVPAGTQTVVSTMTIANRAASQGTYRIAIRPAAATLANQHYIAFDVPIQASDTTALTLGITLNATDVITIFASSADFSFGLFGSEVT